jgi:hypothetical protein
LQAFHVVAVDQRRDARPDPDQPERPPHQQDGKVGVGRALPPQHHPRIEEDQAGGKQAEAGECRPYPRAQVERFLSGNVVRIVQVRSDRLDVRWLDFISIRRRVCRRLGKFIKSYEAGSRTVTISALCFRQNNQKHNPRQSTRLFYNNLHKNFLKIVYTLTGSTEENPCYYSTNIFYGFVPSTYSIKSAFLRTSDLCRCVVEMKS